MRLTVKAKGTKEIIDNIKKYDEETQVKVGTVINNSLKAIAKGMRSRLPKKMTGNLRRGIKKSFSKKKLVGSARATAPHSHLIEFGTKPHAISARRKKVLAIKGNIVGKKVMHPGAKAKPFMQPAYYAERNNYISNLEKAVKP